MRYLGLGDISRRRIERFGIPVDSFNPSYWFIVSLDYESRPPTVDELVLLRAYRDFSIRNTYRETYTRKLLRMERPAEAGHNTVVFRKDGPCRWVYRRVSWQQGPLYAPFDPKTYRPVGIPLPLLMDRIQAIGNPSDPQSFTKSYLYWRSGRSEFARY